MRYLVVVALLLVPGSHASPVVLTQAQDVWVTVTPNGPGATASVRVTNAEMYVGGNASGIRVAGPGSTVPVWFDIRAWKEGAQTRVVVYAKLDDKRAPEGNTETPIATFAIAPGQSIPVPEAKKWGGPLLAVSAALR